MQVAKACLTPKPWVIVKVTKACLIILVVDVLEEVVKEAGSSLVHFSYLKDNSQLILCFYRILEKLVVILVLKIQIM